LSLARNGGIRQNSVNAYLAKVGLDDWKRQLPLGIILAIPIIQNEVLILSEETQLVGCFCLFCGTAYQLGASSVAEMLDAKTKAVIAAQNAVEEKAIGEVKETLAAHEKRIEALELLKSTTAIQAEAESELKVLKAMEFKHVTRDKFVKMLDNLVAKEEQTKAIMTAGIVADAAAFVSQKFDDPAVKQQSLDEAISILELGGQPKLVPALFTDYLKSRTAHAKDLVGSTVPVPSSAVTEIEDEINAIIKRDGLVPPGKVDIPKEVTV